MDELDPTRYRRDDRQQFRGSEPRRAARSRESQPLDQRLDRWLSAGRQLVEGVAGSRPGTRLQARGGEARSTGRGGFDGLGRWVEERLDWFLEDGDDWREPWQESRPRSPSQPLEASEHRRTRGEGSPTGWGDSQAGPELSSAPPGWPEIATPQPAPSDSRNQAAGSLPRRRLEALSRRELPPQSAATAQSQEQESWPEDDSYSLPRWQRPPTASRWQQPAPPAPEPTEGGGRPLPRSTRRATGRP